jgi:hypothetical protein
MDQEGTPMVFDVFISHSSADEAVANTLCQRLEAADIRCWIAPRDILPGLSYAEAIATGISCVRMMVVVLSGRAIVSRHVVQEVRLAAEHGVALLPFRIESAALSAELDYFLGMWQWLEAVPPEESHYLRLVDSVQAHLQIAATPEAPRETESDGAKPPGPELARRLKRVCIMAAVGIVMLSLAAALLIINPRVKAGNELLECMNIPAGFLVTLDTTDGKRVYREGEHIRFVVRTTRDCFLTLITVDSEEQMTLLLPNAWQRKAFVRQDERVEIPPAEAGFHLPIRPPHGRTLVKAIATVKPLVLSGVTEQCFSDQKFPLLEPGVKAIGVEGDSDRTQAGKPQTLDDWFEPREWSTAELVIVTEP